MWPLWPMLVRGHIVPGPLWNYQQLMGEQLTLCVCVYPKSASAGLGWRTAVVHAFESARKPIGNEGQLNLLYY